MPMANNIKDAKIVLVFFTLFLGVSHLSAESSPVKVAFLYIDAVDVSNQLERTINEILISFTSEVKGYVVEDFKAANEKIVVTASDVSYVFTGRVVGIEDGVRLELVFKNRALEMVRCVYKDYEGTSKVLLESRLLVREIFNMPDDIEMARTSHLAARVGNSAEDSVNADVKSLVEEEFNKIYTLDSLAGAWYGEDGEVEKIMIMRGGRGVAIWASGISILLDLKLQDGVLIVSQKGSPQPRQFVSLPDDIAFLAARVAKPIIWQFNVDQDLKVLSGLKTMSSVQYKNNEILSVSEVAVPDRWHRN